jgi:serine/threonine protein kinase
VYDWPLNHRLFVLMPETILFLPKVRELLAIQYGSSGVHGLDESTYERLRLKARDVEVSSTLLGSGQFGFVWQGTLHPQRTRKALPTDVAIKVLKSMSTPGAFLTTAKTEGEHESEWLGERALVQILLEARLHASLKHEHLVQLLGVQDEYQPVMLVMQLCEAGDLRHVLRERSSSPAKDFNEVQQRDMAVQAASGLVFLHQHLCLHRDVAARNVLLTAMSRSPEDLPPCGYVLKLSDLGMTRVLREEGDYYRVCCQGRSGGLGV